MEQSDKVSIIIPVYNVEKYIDECLTSVLNQIYQNFEVLIVDDGSTDSSGRICDEYAQRDKRIKVIHKENGGVSSARNAGIRAATGKFITFCDSDDYVKENWLSDLYTGITTHDCDFCCCNMSRDIAESSSERQNTLPSGLYKQSDFLLLLQEGLLNSPGNKILYRSIIIENNLLFDESINNGEDLLFFLSYLENTKRGFYYTGNKTYIYRVNFSSITHSYIEDYWKLALHRFNYLKSVAIKLGCDPEKCEEIYYALLKDAVYYALNNNINNPSSNIAGKIKENLKIICSRECREAVSLSATTNNKNKHVYTSKFYLSVLIYQIKSLLKK